jgi:hypothetical protein
MNNIEEAYNQMSTITKEDINFPDNFINLTREQEQFIMDLYFTDRESVKKELLQSIEEMKEAINDL